MIVSEAANHSRENHWLSPLIRLLYFCKLVHVESSFPSQPSGVSERYSSNWSEARPSLETWAKSFNDVLRVCSFRNATISQSTLALGRLATQQMATKSTTVLRFSGRRNLEPAFHPFVSFLLWHFTNHYTRTEQTCICSQFASRGV